MLHANLQNSQSKLIKVVKIYTNFSLKVNIFFTESAKQMLCMKHFDVCEQSIINHVVFKQFDLLG